MPEGHTIHRHARYQNLLLAGKRTASTSPQGRFAEHAELISGKKLHRVEPLGKHLFYHFTRGVVHVHLGMYGRYRKIRRGRSPSGGGGGWPEPTPAVRWRLTAPGSRVGVDLTGPTACELLEPDAVQAIRDRIGVDLIGPEAEAARPAVRERVLGSRTPIGVALMDQSLTSGIGNAYRSELLYRARLDPRVPGKDVRPEVFDAVYDDAVYLLRVGVRHRHILCVEPGCVGKTRWRDLAEDERFWVYRRETCRGCGGPVEHIKQAGRSVYLCPAEQGTRGSAEAPDRHRAGTQRTQPGQRDGAAAQRPAE